MIKQDWHFRGHRRFRVPGLSDCTSGYALSLKPFQWNQMVNLYLNMTSSRCWRGIHRHTQKSTICLTWTQGQPHSRIGMKFPLVGFFLTTFTHFASPGPQCRFKSNLYLEIHVLLKFLMWCIAWENMHSVACFSKIWQISASRCFFKLNFQSDLYLTCTLKFSKTVIKTVVAKMIVMFMHQNLKSSVQNFVAICALIRTIMKVITVNWWSAGCVLIVCPVSGISPAPYLLATISCGHSYNCALTHVNLPEISGLWKWKGYLACVLKAWVQINVGKVLVQWVVASGRFQNLLSKGNLRNDRNVPSV